MVSADKLSQRTKKRAPRWKRAAAALDECRRVVEKRAFVRSQTAASRDEAFVRWLLKFLLQTQVDETTGRIVGERRIAIAGVWRILAEDIIAADRRVLPFRILFQTGKP